ncbi:MAG TPA: YjbQ family protein [Candidatus Acidoferrales bacterium]|nr:YjbQ family protein [Candidatus Acidoferrales bacterium]
MVLVSAMHITASVFVNDNEEGLLADIDDRLEKLAPIRRDYRHHCIPMHRDDAHLKNLLLHHQVILPITAGRLDLGPWQRVFYGELT